MFRVPYPLFKALMARNGMYRIAPIALDLLIGQMYRTKDVSEDSKELACLLLGREYVKGDYDNKTAVSSVFNSCLRMRRYKRRSRFKRRA